MAKEDEIKIPEEVLNRANADVRRGQAIADTGSVFTERERVMPRQQGGIGYPSGPFQQGGLPRFPFGGLPSTFMDDPYPANGYSRENPRSDFSTNDNRRVVQYEQDASSRMANRYLLPTAGIAQQNITSGSPFGNRFSATDYVDPYQARRVEVSNASIAENSPMGLYSGKGSVDTSRVPDVGSVGFSRIVDKSSFDQGRTEQIVSPYGFASTALTREQVEQRAQSRQQAEQMGTMPRTPEQQKAMIADMRVKGAALGKERVANMEEFFKQKREEQTALRKATAKAAKSGMDPMAVRQARAAYNKKQPTSIAGIQRQYQEMLPTFNQPMQERIKPVIEPFGFPFGGPRLSTTLDNSTLGTNLGIGGFQNPALLNTTQNRTMASSSQFARGNTTQRNWDNYTGTNPIESRIGTPFYDRSPRYSRRGA